MMNNTNAFEMNKECGGTRDAGMSLTSNLDSPDTIFIFKDNCPVDNKFYNKMVDSVATNNDFTKVLMCGGEHRCRGCNQHIKGNQDQEHK